MTVRISYFVPPQPLLDAKQRGQLDELDLAEVRTTGSPAQLEGLLSGDLDLVVTAIDNLFEWVPAGADVRLVAQTEATTPLGIFARPDSGSLADLTGKRFAVDALASGFALVARHLLVSAGVALDFVEVGGVKERLDALFEGTSDATLLGPPFDAQARAAGMNELGSVQQAFPEFPGQGLIVRHDAPRAELDELLGVLHRHGLLPVSLAGLEVLTAIRRDLGLLPPDLELRSMLQQHDTRTARNSTEGSEWR